MDRKTIVAKFGGTSLADAGQFRKIAAIVAENPQRRFLVVSAPGKRYPEDVKVTDRLLRCYELAAAGEDYEGELGEIEKRFREIQEELFISFPLEEEIGRIREHLQEHPDREYMASRGEY
ncbi:MAG: aspartate kinase, partial [Blautia sp.]|nr:aspartate kinase [Blautia sp.]